MRPAVRLLAAVKPQFLETGTPTGLTGLFTHPTPRGTLSYLYNSTLDKLQRIPESSVYRQSTEALVKHRLSIVDSMEPEGYEAWQERVKKQLEENKDLTGPHGIAMLHSHGGNQFITSRHKGEVDERIEEWDGAEDKEPELEGTRSKEERAIQFQKLAEEAQKPATGHMEIEPEPQLTKAQIEEMEAKIGAGLIEEVIQVAEGEHMLVNRMIEAQVWDELEEKPRPGQWEYFERNAHTSTQGR